MNYQGPIRPGMRFRFVGDECTVTGVRRTDICLVDYQWTGTNGDHCASATSDITFRACERIRPAAPEEWALYAPEGPINNQLRAADLRPGMVVATTMPTAGTANIWWLWRFEHADGDGNAHGDIFAGSHETGISRGLFGHRTLLAHSIILFDAEDGEAKPYTTTVVDKPEPGAVNMGALERQPIRRSGPDIEPDDRMLVVWARFSDGRDFETTVSESVADFKARTIAPEAFIDRWNAGCFDIYEMPGPVMVYENKPSVDPRDAAIAKWPWMMRFREVKAGDVFEDYAPMACDMSRWPSTVTVVDWKGGWVTWANGIGWRMTIIDGWGDLRVVAATPTAPTCNACHKPAPLGYAGRCWPCETEAEHRIAAETDGYLGCTKYQRDGNVILNDWADRIRADMALDVSPLPGGAGFGALWRGRVPKL